MTGSCVSPLISPARVWQTLTFTKGLWGAGGQEALEETHILLINNGPGVATVETLKNLVLPGIGHFTILDSALVSEADLGVNFFLEDESLGKFRADETVRLLMELNPDVTGHAIKEVRTRS